MDPQGDRSYRPLPAGPQHSRKNGKRGGAKPSNPEIPGFQIGTADQFEKPNHMALWARNHPDGPTVIINRDSPVVVEAVAHHQGLYPPIHEEEVRRIVWEAFGEMAAGKVAHTQSLTHEQAEEEVDRLYRSEEALTTALMGLVAEDSLIRERLGKLGRKLPRTSAASTKMKS